MSCVSGSGSAVASCNLSSSSADKALTDSMLVKRRSTSTTYTHTHTRARTVTVTLQIIYPSIEVSYISHHTCALRRGISTSLMHRSRSLR